MKELDLRMFDDVSAPTIIFDSGQIISVTTDKETYENNEKITLNIQYATGNMLDRAIVIYPSGKSFNASLTNIKFKTGAYFFIILITKPSLDGRYIVTEPVMININGKRIHIDPSQRLRIKDGELSLSGTPGAVRVIADSDAVKYLIAQKVLIPARSSEYNWAEIVK